MSKNRADPATKPSTIIEDKEGFGHKPDASKLKLMRTSKGHVKGTLTIPVIATDTVSDLKRKLRRTLAPLIERNLTVAPAQTHQPFGETMIRTPGKSPMRTPPRNHFSDSHDLSGNSKSTNDGRKLTSESKTAGVRSLSFSKLRNLSPNPKPILHSPQHCPVEPAYSPGGPRSGPLPPKKPLDDHPMSTYAPPSAKKLTFASRTEATPDVSSTADLVRNTSKRFAVCESGVYYYVCLGLSVPSIMCCVVRSYSS